MYALDLLNIGDKYPGLSELLEEGAFSIRGGNQDSSRVGVDMALDLTISASAERHIRGIVALGSTDSAVNRWLK